MADDPHLGVRLAGQAVGELVQDRTHVRLDVRAARVEGQVARHVQLQLVVGRLLHGHAAAHGGLLHGLLLLLHVLGPDVAARGADTGADQRPRRVLADRRAGQGADARADGGVLLGAGHAGVHVGAAGQEQGRRARCQQAGSIVRFFI
jgi:hypothetical protein